MTPTKEQMELAAKACGIERLHFDATGTAFQVKGNVIGSSWRPLTSTAIDAHHAYLSAKEKLHPFAPGLAA